MTLDYQAYLDEVIVAAADAQNGNKVKPFSLALFHSARFPQCPSTWLTTAATTLHEQGYGVDWQDTNNTSFLINGQGLLRAETIRRERSASDPKSSAQNDQVASIDWTKWGTIFGALGVVVAIVIAVLT